MCIVQQVRPVHQPRSRCIFNTSMVCLCLLQDDDVSLAADIDILMVRMYHNDVTGLYPMMIDAVTFTTSGTTSDYYST